MGNNKCSAYGALCSFYYDATEAFAPQPEVDFYASVIEQNPGRVLEAMYGSGRLQIPLLQRGYNVDGVDSSPYMLDRCRERCAELALLPNLYEQVIEELSIDQKYSTVIVALASFQLIIDREKALKALKQLRAHMISGGTLLIDIFVPEVKIPEESVSMAHIDDHIAIRLTKKYLFDIDKKIAEAYCIYELLIDGIVQQQEDELIQLTWYTDQELTQLLAQSGFEVEKVYDRVFRPAGPSRIVQAIAL